jgi:hypothetical protein
MATCAAVAAKISTLLAFVRIVILRAKNSVKLAFHPILFPESAILLKIAIEMMRRAAPVIMLILVTVYDTCFSENDLWNMLGCSICYEKANGLEEFSI